MINLVMNSTVNFAAERSARQSRLYLPAFPKGSLVTGDAGRTMQDKPAGLVLLLPRPTNTQIFQEYTQIFDI